MCIRDRHYNSQKLELTKNEFRILPLLFERRCRTVPRKDIMQSLMIRIKQKSIFVRYIFYTI